MKNEYIITINVIRNQEHINYFIILFSYNTHYILSLLAEQRTTLNKDIKAIKRYLAASARDKNKVTDHIPRSEWEEKLYRMNRILESLEPNIQTDYSLHATGSAVALLKILYTHFFRNIVELKISTYKGISMQISTQ